MLQKKQIVQFVVQNRTDCGFNVPIFEFNVFSVNATTKYSWNVTTADYSCLQALITVNGVTYTIDFDGTLIGLLTGLNALNYGFFCSETIGGNTFIYTYDDTNIYADLQTCLVGTTTTTSSTTTTTTASLKYLTDQYACGTCTLLANNVVVGSNFSLDILDYFLGDDGKVYQILGTTTGVAVTNISDNTAYVNCASIPCPTTTTTTTTTTTIAPTTTTTTTTTTIAPTTTSTTTTTTTTLSCQQIFLYPSNINPCDHAGVFTQFDTDNAITPTIFYVLGGCGVTPVVGGNRWYSQGVGSMSYQVNNSGQVIATFLCP